MKGPSNSFSRIEGLGGLEDLISALFQGGSSGREMIIDLDDLEFLKRLDTDEEGDPAMKSKSYGGISFQSQFMNLEVQGDGVHVDVTPHQQFRSNMLNGIIPLVVSIKRYSFDLNNP